jgi:23S rRNA (uridine2552-2'-O)-methyltransferase
MQKNIRNKFTRLKTARGRTNSSARWLSRQLNDPYVKKAKALNYRSRAAFKIIEIDEKFQIFKKNKMIIDLGATPGGWSQIAVLKNPNNILALDLLEMEEIEGVKFIQQDFTDSNIVKIIENILKNDFKNRKKCDIIMSDMAQNTCGDVATDHIRIISLLEECLDFAIKFLKEGGIFIGKSFQGGSDQELLQKFKNNFKIVKHFKPKSSRKESKENYIIAIGFKNLS